MNRRGFMGSILALGAAPAIVRADSLMRVISRDQGLYVGPGEGYTVDLTGLGTQFPGFSASLKFSRDTCVITMHDGLIVTRPIVRIA